MHQQSKKGLHFRLICCILALGLAFLLTWSVSGLYTPIIYGYGLAFVVLLACLGLIRAFFMERKISLSSNSRSATVRWFASIFGIALVAVYFLHDGWLGQIWYQFFPFSPVFGFLGSCFLLLACFLMLGIALKPEWASMTNDKP